MADGNKLELILTQYGLDRITGAIPGPETLALTKVRIGSGDNNKYYEPDVTQEGLKGDLNYEFYIYDKQLLEDGLTVSFHTIIPEDVSGFDIREVGLYEVIGNEEHLFAIATQQPIVKPAVEYNYFIKVDYYIFLRNQNLADSYDRITLDVEHAQVSEADLESLLRSFLFAQENLMLQIGKNSELIGYNRPSQIVEKVNENKQNYSYITLYKNFASVLDTVNSPSDILSYWAFDYSRRETLGGSIVDLSNNREYLSTSASIGTLPHVYRGFQSMFTFTGSNSYYLPSDKPIDLYDTEKEQDKPFTMIFSVEPNEDSFNITRTLLAKSNRATGAVVFEVQELSTRALQVRLYTDKDNYVTFRTSDNVIPKTAHTIILTCEPAAKLPDEGYSSPSFIAYINSREFLLDKVIAESPGTYTHMNTEVTGTLYKYTCTPHYETLAAVDSNDIPEVICNPDGSPAEGITKWFILDDKIMYGSTENEGTLDETFEPIEVTLYAHVVPGSSPLNIIYTKTEEPTGPSDLLYDSDFNIYEDTDWVINEVGGEYKIFYNNGVSDEPTQLDPSKDIVRTIKKFTYTAAPQNIYTVTNDLVRTNYPLYELNVVGERVTYDIYTGTDWTIEPKAMTPGKYELVYDNTFIGSFDGQVDDVPGAPITSYIIDNDGSVIDNINSSVGIISILDEKLEPAEARILALNLCATLGMNPFLTGE